MSAALHAVPDPDQGDTYDRYVITAGDLTARHVGRVITIQPDPAHRLQVRSTLLALRVISADAGQVHLALYGVSDNYTGGAFALDPDAPVTVHA